MSSKDWTADAGRDPVLDGLRGIAILLVLAFHFLRFDAQAVWSAWADAALRSGWIGVDLFFVLSGFLITGILIRSRAAPQRARRFYLRRALRILPAYYLVLTLTMLLIVWLVPAPEIVADSLDRLPGLLLFVQNLESSWDGLPAVRELGVLWSLSVEEQFYLLWPWLVWRLPVQKLAGACLRGVLLVWAIKLALYLAEAPALSLYLFTPARLDGFLLGGYLAAVRQSGQARLPPAAWAAVGLGAALLAAVFLSRRGLSMFRSSGELVLTTSALAVVFAGLLQASLSAAPDSWLRRGLSTPLLGWFSFYSYGLYLVHMAADTWVRLCLQPWLEPVLSTNAMALGTAGCSLLLSGFLAWLLYRLVEAPALRLKDRFRLEPAAERRPAGNLDSVSSRR